MRPSSVNAIGALLICLALWLVPTQALGQIVNENFNFVDQKEPDTTGSANHMGSANQGVGRTTCRDGSNTAFFQGVSTHPQIIKLKMGSAALKQGAANNKPNVRVNATGAMSFNVLLNCEKASIDTRIKVTPPPGVGRFRVQASNCTELTEAQALYVENVCAADSENKTIRVKVDGSTIRSLRIRGKGPVVPPM